jgi:hypothetical protein
MNDWRTQGLCNPDNADLFDRRASYLTEDNLRALQLCRACPVRKTCAEDVLGAPSDRRALVIAAGMTFDRDGEPCTPNMPPDLGRRRQQWREAARRARDRARAERAREEVAA